MRSDMIFGLEILITAFISYIITITFAGWFEAFVALKVGDDTPEQTGFLTLNPLDHFSVFGFAAVLWGIFFGDMLPIKLIPGWGRYIPLFPENIRGPYYKVLIFIEYTGRAYAHLILLLAAMTIMMLICGPMYVHIDAMGGFTAMLSPNEIALKEVLVNILLFICQQNLVLFVIHFIVGILKYIVYFHLPRLQEFSMTMILFSFILLIIALSIFGPVLHLFATQMIENIRSVLLFIIK